METGIFRVLWLILYWYYVEQAGDIEKGTGKRVLGFLLTAGLLVLSFWLPVSLVWVLICAVMVLYDLFFDQEPIKRRHASQAGLLIKRQWSEILLPGIILVAGSLLVEAGIFPELNVYVLHTFVVLVFLLFLAKKRESLSLVSGSLTVLIYLMVAVFLQLTGSREHMFMEEGLRKALQWGGVLLTILLFLVTEGALFVYKRGFEFQTEQFRQELMEHQYKEIKDVYMDMRGWRHDYHNHIQVMKAQLAMGNLTEIHDYLDKLEKELDHVDTLVKSGNMMVDAILNSKLTLARRQGIAVNCKVKVPERISVEDVDLCVILGNLMDNALEACQLIGEKDRFLRIYMTVNKSQLYLSIQNSAKQDPDFNERNYISRKRGNHGLGMKRVQAAVDKYQGYLNLANEPGIFAAEVTMPIGEFPDVVIPEVYKKNTL